MKNWPHTKASAFPSNLCVWQNIVSLNSIETGDVWLKIPSILLCIWYRGNISSRFSSNSEANASELLKNLEEIWIRNKWHMELSTYSVCKGLHSNYNIRSLWIFLSHFLEIWKRLENNLIIYCYYLGSFSISLTIHRRVHTLSCD